MLEDQIAGRNDSWAVRWLASAFLANKLTLYPGRSLVHNIGNDASGVHCGTTEAYDVSLSATRIVVGGVPVQESEAGRRAFVGFFRGNAGITPAPAATGGKVKRVLRRIVRLIRGTGGPNR
jgi:hypothetical protein